MYSARALLPVLGACHALHELTAAQAAGGGECVAPGQCVAPATKFSRVIAGPGPGQQWNINGGFCGSFSTQRAALAVGAWLSQDLVRRANRNSSGWHFMHGDRTLGYEVMPSNVAATAAGLRLAFDEWDYTRPSPQAPEFKRWLKRHLARGHPIVWFPMCKGDPHVCYPGSCPNGGAVDHVEPMYGIFSNRPLSDDAVHEDDWIVHASDQDMQPYYRRLSSLDDGVAMDGNCAKAQPGFGRNEMFPCFDRHVTYGLAVTGLAIAGPTLPVSIDSVDGGASEPNVRRGVPPSTLRANVTVGGLRAGGKYVLYRFNGTEALPAGPPYAGGHEFATPFTARGDVWRHADPHGFASDSAIYYVAVDAAGEGRAVGGSGDE